jgi:pimeloyl-ACP methyl ester carboxylesterase
MPVSTANANGLQLEYETFGRAEHPAILLIMGLGGQLTLWPEAFCRALADAGHYVIRYDNRDVGLSTKLDALGKPRVLRASVGYKLGMPVRAAYTLDDMAEDAIGLLDALNIGTAHVIGASMGGMIAQLLGARYPQRVKSLVLIMTNRGGRFAKGPSVKVALRLLKRPVTRDRDTLIDHSLATWKMIGSPSYQTTHEEMRARVAEHFDRAHDPAGVARQTLAILASASRKPLLGGITAPTLIVHGAIDPLIPVAAARDLARLIPGAKLEIIPGMGHDLPQPLMPGLAASVLQHIAGKPKVVTMVPRASRPQLLPLLGRRRAAGSRRGRSAVTH